MVYSPTLPPSRSIGESLQLSKLADLRSASTSSLISPVVLRGVMRLIDVAMTVSTGIGIGIAYGVIRDPAEALVFCLVFSLSIVAMLAFSRLLGLYSARAIMSPSLHLPQLVLAWTASITAAAAATALLAIGPDHHEATRLWLLVWFGTGALCLIAGRFAAGLLVRGWARAGRLNRRAAIYGASDIAQDVLRRLEADAGADIRICGVFDDRQNGRAPSVVNGYPRLGTLEALIATGRTTRIDLIIVALPAAAEARLAAVTDKLSELPADIRLPAAATRLKISPRLYSHVGPVAMIDLCDKPIADWGFIFKSAFDKVLAILAVLILSPLMLAVAAAIKLDSRGPIFFRQTRYGFNNEPIEIIKFRSMHTAAADATASQLVTKDDARVTRVGRCIRRTSLDELPQLFNVIMGDLSLVGPRPHAPAAKADDRLYAEVVSHYFARHKVKPGITGWAQINGWRGETNTREKIEKRVEHDLYYIENWSVLFDLYILALTPSALFKVENAY